MSETTNMVSGIYVASRASVPERSAMWRAHRDAGVPITSSWIDEAGEGETADFAELWARIEGEIRGSCGLVLYAEREDFPLKGALVEVGIALGLGLPVFVVTDAELDGRTLRPLGSWLRHPLCQRAVTVESAFITLAARPQSPPTEAGDTTALDVAFAIWHKKESPRWHSLQFGDTDRLLAAYCAGAERSAVALAAERNQAALLWEQCLTAGETIRSLESAWDAALLIASKVKGLAEEQHARADTAEARVKEVEAALEVADAAINPPNRSAISLHEWNEHLKLATIVIRGVLSTQPNEGERS